MSFRVNTVKACGKRDEWRSGKYTLARIFYSEYQLAHPTPLTPSVQLLPANRGIRKLWDANEWMAYHRYIRRHRKGINASEQNFGFSGLTARLFGCWFPHSALR